MNTKRVQKASSGITKEGDRFVMWAEGGDGERYTSPPMALEQAWQLLESWKRTAVPLVSLHLSADVAEQLDDVAEQWNRGVRPPGAECLTTDDIVELVITTWLEEGEPTMRLRYRPRQLRRARARRSTARKPRVVKHQGTEPEAAGG